jgi:adenylosuccinate synthase
MINGVTKVIMTKADVLDNFAELNVCTAYGIDGKETSYVPFQMTRHQIKPELKSFSGWNIDTTKVTDYAGLPGKMKEYVAYINQFVGVNVSHISNGPGRDQIVAV